MGVPTKTQVEAWTDRVAALVNSDLAGLEDALASSAGACLSDRVGASVDAEVRNALGASALAVDVMSLPENAETFLASITNRAAYRDFATALNNQVVTYGGYDNLRAYLAAKSATVHPVYAELHRAVFGVSAFTDSDGDITTVFPPAYSTRTADRVYTGADGSLSEDTTDAGDAGTADVTLFASDNDCLYIGSRYQFSQVVIGLSTKASATIEPTFQYWNGSAWTTLTVTDNSAGLTKNDTIKWAIPDDWERCSEDGGGTDFADLQPRYYVRIARTANSLVTPPVATCIRIVPATVTAAGVHVGLPQPPLAIVRVTNTNTIVVEQIAEVNYARFIEAATVKFRALTAISANVTMTLAYVNEGGSNASSVQSAWSSIDALDTFDVALSGSDKLRNVRTSGGSATTTATEGVFEVYAVEERTPAL